MDWFNIFQKNKMFANFVYENDIWINVFVLIGGILFNYKYYKSRRLVQPTHHHQPLSFDPSRYFYYYWQF